MSLRVESHGNGAPLLLIHGWGMHGGMWGDLVPQLAQQFRVHVVDLPGHGLSAGQTLLRHGDDGAAATADQLLDAVVDELSAQFATPLNVCGWSLGGLVALRWALRQPQQVKRLVLLASTPCFVQRPDWPCAMASETLAEFAEALQQNYAQTLRRFLALQVRGSEYERELLATLRATLFARGEPDSAALQAGLALLRDCDLRGALSEVEQPVLVIAGERDTLTPLRAAQYLAQQAANAQLAVIHGAAHAPFLSHPAEVMEHLKNFLHE
ncbi:MAG TPA: pimeloyl-ACP methyl ester esterase BioH [Gallionella sp.]|nr:pimeloyl-ACP methyl ester esterase BioH [Gallionella sp.]